MQIEQMASILNSISINQNSNRIQQISSRLLSVSNCRRLDRSAEHQFGVSQQGSVQQQDPFLAVSCSSTTSQISVVVFCIHGESIFPIINQICDHQRLSTTILPNTNRSQKATMWSVLSFSNTLCSKPPSYSAPAGICSHYRLQENIVEGSFTAIVS